MAVMSAPEALRLAGKAVADKRQAAGLTQRQVADRIGVDPLTVSRVERGQGSFNTLLTIAEALDFDLFTALAEPDEGAA